jgi:hypothetical protein
LYVLPTEAISGAQIFAFETNSVNEHMEGLVAILSDSGEFHEGVSSTRRFPADFTDFVPNGSETFPRLHKRDSSSLRSRVEFIDEAHSASSVSEFKACGPEEIETNGLFQAGIGPDVFWVMDCHSVPST